MEIVREDLRPQLDALMNLQRAELRNLPIFAAALECIKTALTAEATRAGAPLKIPMAKGSDHFVIVYPSDS